MTSHCRFLVTGRVQGVGFRYATTRQARQLGLRGWVRNLADGSVEVEAHGNKQALEVLERWLRQGPRHAAVVDVERSEADAADFPDFASRG